jgi:type II secretory pathway pseudopilin PulG
MTTTETIKKSSICDLRFAICKKKNRKLQIANRKSERGMSLIAIMAMMTLFSLALLAVAPSVQQSVQREKEREAIRRGEEVAEAIRRYVTHYQGAKLPESIDELLEGLPQGTKKVQILRESSAVDPLSEDGKWKLVPMNKLGNFARRVQNYNNGLLPSSENLPRNIADQVGAFITNTDFGNEDDNTEGADSTDEESFDTPFIGVVSQSQSKSVIAYYGIENHSKWIFTPLFRGAGGVNINRNNDRRNNLSSDER